ncbi:MAG: DNA translocase FtsK [Bacteroidales bacterium]|nr:DNA translocase FtsK [Bacteroidales bacterium]
MKKSKSAKTKKGKNKIAKEPREPLLSSADARVLRILSGFICLAITIFTVVALVSYIFTWTADQSLVRDPQVLSSAAEEASNSGGRLGLVWADFLISKLFGLGAFVVPFFFGAISIGCFRIRKVNLLRLLIVSLIGAIVISLICAYLSGFTKYEFLLGNGLGGSYGRHAVSWLRSMLGNVGTGCVLMILLLLWLVLLSKKVALRFDDLMWSVAQRSRREKDLVASGDPESVAEEEGEVEEEETLDDNTIVDPEYKDLQPVETTEVVVDPAPVSQTTVVPATFPVGDNPEDVIIQIEGSDNDFIKNLTEEEKSRLFDPRLDLPDYRHPSLSLLNDYRDKWYTVSMDELEKNKIKIVTVLGHYKIKVVAITAKMGPTVTLYKIHLADGMKVSQVRSREEDIALSLGAKGVRVVTLIDSVGIEVANEKPSIVPLKSILNDPKFKNANMELPLAMGITVTNEPFFLDLAKMPHLLIAGATGMGKSVGLNCIITSLLYTKHPAELKFVMVDPKKVELSLYSKLDKHFLAKIPDEAEAIITDTRKVVNTLKSLCVEMEDRYELLKLADMRHIRDYNKKFLNRRLNPQKGHKFLPYIVVVIDEFADLLVTAGKEIEEPIARLAQQARAVGIHLVIATQRPTTDIITGTIKANFNSRIAYKVNASIDSRTILDTPGANRLIGRGDMLVMYPGEDIVRVQCAFVDTPEIIAITKDISSQSGYDHEFYLPEVSDDEDSSSTNEFGVNLKNRDALFEDAAKIVVMAQQGSTSLIQRKLEIGYARAGRIIDQLEAAGIVGPFGGSRARDVLVSDLATLDIILETLDRI